MCALVTGVQTFAIPIFPHDMGVVDDLLTDVHGCAALLERPLDRFDRAFHPRAVPPRGCPDDALDHLRPVYPDRNSVVWGTGVSVRLDIGGGRIIINKTTQH